MLTYTFTELGYFTENECNRIKEQMEGRSYMKFHVTWSNYAGNCTLIVSADYEGVTMEEFKNFFLAVAMSQLARKI